MDQNFTILGMYDRSSIMSIIDRQPETYRFILAAVDTAGGSEEWKENRGGLSREKELLNHLGIRGNLLGYNYILDALKMIRRKPDTLKNITKELYPDLALKYRTQSCNIERAIRHAIEHAWNAGNTEWKNRIFGYETDPEKSRPSNGEFLAVLAHFLNYEV